MIMSREQYMFIFFTCEDERKTEQISLKGSFQRLPVKMIDRNEWCEIHNECFKGGTEGAGRNVMRREDG